ncbi:MAG: hypothetical protein B6D59_05780 [Campylobacteraceae bacterium 4484_4]|nr:MAG: hypothetical protein B6D59_05780 [Campylobacteraceae bacterium 4484_4]
MALNYSEHGLQIGIKRDGETFLMELRVEGKLTHKDYELFVPFIENAIKDAKAPKIKAYIDARGFKGWDIHGAWDDLKFGLKHNREFEKIAVVGNSWLEKAGINLSKIFMHGQMRYFEDPKEAKEWLLSD